MSKRPDSGRGGNALQVSGKTNKDVSILLLKGAPKHLPFCSSMDLCDCGLKGFFFSSPWFTPQMIFV